MKKYTPYIVLFIALSAAIWFLFHKRGDSFAESKVFLIQSSVNSSQKMTILNLIAEEMLNNKYKVESMKKNDFGGIAIANVLQYYKHSDDSFLQDRVFVTNDNGTMALTFYTVYFFPYVNLEYRQNRIKEIHNTIIRQITKKVKETTSK